MIKKLNFYHSLFFFNICIILSALEFLKSKDFLILCFFLILSIGISHGALDHLKGKKLLKIFKIKNIFIFYIGYIVISLFVIICWILMPKVTLIIFLFIACYHFGKEDTDFLINPCTRFRGSPGEQKTMFIQDPSGNAIEFKAFKSDNMIFQS